MNTKLNFFIAAASSIGLGFLRPKLIPLSSNESLFLGFLKEVYFIIFQNNFLEIFIFQKSYILDLE